MNERNGAPVTVDVEDGVALLTLADPARRNVLSAEMVEALLAAYQRLEADPGTRCVVLTGQGRAFCAGAELSVLEDAASGRFDGVETVYRGFLRVLESALPTIAVVHGPAVGAGLNLALAADLRLAVDGAVFDSRFLALSLTPGGGHSWLLERLVGKETATAMMLFGEQLDAEQAVRAGLAYSRHPDLASGLDAARRLAGRLAAQDGAFVAALTSLSRRAGVLGSHQDALALERYTQRWSTSRPDFLDGVRRMRAAVHARPG